MEGGIVHRVRNGRPSVVGLLLVLGILATACGAKASAGGSGDLSLSIASPSDGASVSQPFTVKLDASVPLGDPSTGDHHVHLCFDGGSCDTEYTLTYGDSIEVSGLSAGTHTIEASLRNADHSDAGPTDQITVTVKGGGTEGSSDTTGGHGYGY
jgi:hypothetical protein